MGAGPLHLQIQIESLHLHDLYLVIIKPVDILVAGNATLFMGTLRHNDDYISSTLSPVPVPGSDFE